MLPAVLYHPLVSIHWRNGSLGGCAPYISQAGNSHPTAAGNIANWNKKAGEAFAAGDSLADIETDKATMTWEAQDEGFVAKLLVEAGSADIQVGQFVLVVVEEEVSCGLGVRCSGLCWEVWDMLPGSSSFAVMAWLLTGLPLCCC